MSYFFPTIMSVNRNHDTCCGSGVDEKKCRILKYDIYFGWHRYRVCPRQKCRTFGELILFPFHSNRCIVENAHCSHSIRDANENERKLNIGIFYFSGFLWQPKTVQNQVNDHNGGKRSSITQGEWAPSKIHPAPLNWVNYSWNDSYMLRFDEDGIDNCWL